MMRTGVSYLMRSTIHAHIYVYIYIFEPDRNREVGRQKENPSLRFFFVKQTFSPI